MKMFLLLIYFAAFSLLFGCNNMEPRRDPAYAPAVAVVPTEPPVGNGSIYQNGYGTSWFEDLRARRVGDLLTVKLVEKTEGAKKNKNKIDKESTTSVDPPTFLGKAPAELSASLHSNHEFEGKGDSNQSNKLTGDITVTVIEVLPNGNLKVRGEKRIGINKGNEYLKLSGIVRSQDIDASNTVLSTKIADPTIVYNGDGAMAESNGMGWLARFFIGALMPF